jgi:cell division septum initiation protein DivIVA
MSEIEEKANEALKPGKFSIINVLRGRGYPTQEVSVYVDDSRAYEAAKLQEKIDKLEENINPTDAEIAEAKKLTKTLAIIVKEMDNSRYVFLITGISEGKREELLERAIAAHPIEHEEIKHPFTGEVTKKDKESPERNKLFTDLLWEANISKITAPDGSVQEDVLMEDVMDLRNLLPVASAKAITDATENIRISTAVFMFKADEDFLAKS